LKLCPVEPWPEPVDGATLLDDLSRLLLHFVVLPPGAADALALWTLHTYAFHLRDITACVVRVDWSTGQPNPTLANFSCWCPKIMAADAPELPAAPASNPNRLTWRVYRTRET
jgi:hypothetical protein